MSAPKNNKFTSKPTDEQFTSILTVRCHPKQKSAWVKAAHRSEDKKLSPWVIRQLNQAASLYAHDAITGEAESKDPNSMKTYSYSEIANSYALWMEYADPSGFDSREAFDSKTEEEKVAFLVSCFGSEPGKEPQS